MSKSFLDWVLDIGWQSVMKMEIRMHFHYDSTNGINVPVYTISYKILEISESIFFDSYFNLYMMVFTIKKDVGFDMSVL